MWKIKTFTTREQMTAYLDRHGAKLQWHEIFVNNTYGIQYRRLRTIG